MIPLVVTPKILSAKNRWKSGTSLRGQFGRDIVLGTFSLLVMFSIYYGLTVVLQKAQSSQEVAYFHPSNILDILLLFLYGLLFFSSAITTLGLFYLSEDMPLIISSPISKGKIFYGKLLEVTASATWMILVFGLPGIIAFGTSYGGGSWYYLNAAIALIPYFLIPSAISIAAVTIFASIVPANRTREILIIAGLILILAAYFALRLMGDSANIETNSINDLLHLVNLIQIPDTSYLPSHWAATIIGQSLKPSDLLISPYLICLVSVSISCVVFAYLTFYFLFDRAYSMAQSNGGNGRMTNLINIGSLPFLSLVYSQEERALLNKEISVFLRDMTQSVQLMLLLGLCSVYLYNLKILRVVDQLPDAAKIWWQSFLTIGNMAMGAFVIAAVCTRFVFPSISLEGRAYWVLRSSPLSIVQLLKAKFKIWYIPVSSIGSILLLSGAFAIQAPIHIVIISCIMSWIVCIGIVGLGVGLGAVYANFDWEHTSQLAASFGSLIYMLVSTMFIGINLIPITVLMLIKNLQSQHYQMSATHWNMSMASCILFLIYLNYLTAKWALKIGENSLMEREKS